MCHGNLRVRIDRRGRDGGVAEGSPHRTEVEATRAAAPFSEATRRDEVIRIEGPVGVDVAVGVEFYIHVIAEPYLLRCPRHFQLPTCRQQPGDVCRPIHRKQRPHIHRLGIEGRSVQFVQPRVAQPILQRSDAGIGFRQPFRQDKDVLLACGRRSALTYATRAAPAAGVPFAIYHRDSVICVGEVCLLLQELHAQRIRQDRQRCRDDAVLRTFKGYRPIEAESVLGLHCAGKGVISRVVVRDMFPCHQLQKVVGIAVCVPFEAFERCVVVIVVE